MNYEQDAKRFASIMKITWQSCKRNHPDKETMSYWFGKLDKYEFTEVEQAFDTWLTNQDELPTIHEIIKLCQHKVTIHARLPSPLAVADNKRHINEVQTYIAKNIKPTKDMRAWAHKIIDSPSRYPDISFKIAKEALAIKSEIKE